MEKSLALDVEAAAAYARKYDLHALLIERGGEIQHEEYAGGYDTDKPHALYSGTKSFWSVAAAAAVDDGLLQFDDLVSNTLTEWQADSRKSMVTIRQLLSMTAGVAFGGLGAGVPEYGAAMSKPLASEPGTVFTYGGLALQIFGALLARKLAPQKQAPFEYLKARIFTPIGLEVGPWRTLKDGTHTLPTGAFVTARDWAKFGALLAQRGIWQRRHLVTPENLEECWRPTALNPRYGMGFWLYRLACGLRVAYASGSGKQSLYVCPDQQVVVVHFAQSKTFNHERFLQHLFGK